MRFGEGVTALLEPVVDVRHAVLENAQRTDDGAVHASEQQREQQQGDDHKEVEGQHGGQELHLRHPREEFVQRAGEIEEHQRDAEEEDRREHPPDSL